VGFGFEGIRVEGLLVSSCGQFLLFLSILSVYVGMSYAFFCFCFLFFNLLLI